MCKYKLGNEGSGCSALEKDLEITVDCKLKYQHEQLEDHCEEGATTPTSAVRLVQWRELITDVPHSWRGYGHTPLARILDTSDLSWAHHNVKLAPALSSVCAVSYMSSPAGQHGSVMSPYFQVTPESSRWVPYLFNFPLLPVPHWIQQQEKRVEGMSSGSQLLLSWTSSSQGLSVTIAACLLFSSAAEYSKVQFGAMHFKKRHS